jgi:DNA-binding NtrC family response regulator
VNPRVLVVDDERSIQRATAGMLDLEGYEVATASSGEEALGFLDQSPFHAVLLDVRMPGALDGIETLSRIRASHPEVAVVMMSGQSTLETAVRAIRSGAVDFVEKPLSSDKLLVTLANAVRLFRLQRENSELRAQLGQPAELVGKSSALAATWRRIERAAPSTGCVLITGESGTGKELVARAIHSHSRRASGPFVKLNCAAIPSELIESELFGHERGAFTGAVSRKIGKFELASGGTLLLDEIGDMHLDAQAKLLRVLQEGELERVGGTQTIRVDVRIVAATNKDLPRAIEQGRFREDLYWRINVVPISLPPLRERRGDIPLLVEHFLQLSAKQNDRGEVRIDQAAIERLCAHDYPGNVRELRNVVERLVILSGSTITSADVDELGFGGSRKQAAGWNPGEPLRVALARAERGIVEAALREYGGNMTHTAQALDLERSNLYKKLKMLGLRAPGESASVGQGEPEHTEVELEAIARKSEGN